MGLQYLSFKWHQLDLKFGDVLLKIKIYPLEYISNKFGKCN